MPFNVTSYDSSTNRIVVPSSSEESVVPGDLKVSGNLTVSGTTTTVNTEVATADRYIALNANYAADSALDGGLVFNVDPEGGTALDGSSDTLTFTSATAFTVNSNVTANFSANDIIQISNAADPGDNGLYQVHSASFSSPNTTVTIKDASSNTPNASVSGFVKKAFDSTSGADSQMLVAVVKVGVFQTDQANDKFQVAFGSSNLSFANLLTSADSITASAIAADDITAGDAAVTIQTSSGNVTIDSNAGSAKLDGHTGVEIVSSNSGQVDITSAADIDINATSGLTMDSTTLSIDSTDTTNLTMSANSSDAKVFLIEATNAGSGLARMDINGGNTLQLDAGDISIDGTDDSNYTVTGSGKDLDLAVAGGGTQELRLTSAGTGASALHLNASAGGINIDSADMIDIDAADEITIDTTSADGHIALTSAHTAGDAFLISANAHAGSILDIDAGILDVDVQGEATIDATGISLDSDAASNFTTSSGALTLTSAAACTWSSGAGALTLTSAAAATWSTGAGALSIDGAGGLNLIGNSSEIDITTSGALDLNSGAFTLDASTLSIDSTDATNLTMTANSSDNKTLLIESANSGSGLALLDINGGNTLQMDAGDISIDSTDSSNFTMTANSSSAKTLLIQANNSGSGDGDLDLDADDNLDLQIAGTSVVLVQSGGVTAAQNVTFSAEKSAVYGSLKLMPTYALDSGVTCAAGDVLAIKSNGKVIKADADAISTCRVLGVACEAQGSAGGNVRVASVGEMSGNSGSGYDSLTVGAPVYVSTTAGQITQTAPSGAGDVVFEIGFAVAAAKIFVAPRFIAEL